jgi:hypothetical protein
MNTIFYRNPLKCRENKWCVLLCCGVGDVMFLLMTLRCGVDDVMLLCLKVVVLCCYVMCYDLRCGVDDVMLMNLIL